MHSLSDIRHLFLSYFKEASHEVVPSSALIPNNDPTLLFTAAGMVQFKNTFTGAEKRSYQRAASSQKCLRAGGKHNDLENVGRTSRHHTFFEMLGNFSFGDYFKEEAIFLAWNLITKDFALPKERLLVTVYSEDEEAASLWRKIAGFSDDRIIRISTSDNFWSAGDTGPCGPCSEIFYDHGEHIAGGVPGSADEDGDRFTEIWNLVFMQFDQLASGERVNLPKPSIDTGMGLERVSAVLQGVHDNFDIDLFKTIIAASVEISGVKAEGAHRVSHRVIADHLRAASFLIADGVLPSNEGRGYVLRRIMRRAMRHAYLLGCQDPMMWRLVPTLVQLMGTAYPELTRAEALVSNTLRLEEERFKQTLGRGLKLLTEETSRLSSGQPLPGDVAFKLYDTYGFPLDLTQDVMRGQGLSVDNAGFDQAMERQRAEARASWVGSGDQKTEHLWFSIQDKVGPTEFLGYRVEDAEAIVGALVVETQLVTQVTAQEDDTPVLLVVNQTPFYGESGGQMGDAGCLVNAAGDKIAIEDTSKKLGTLHVHQLRLKKGQSIEVGSTVHLYVDGGRRQNLRAHHSATHLLHAALRRSLGDSVVQKGSLVAPDRLRFDFSYSTAVPKEVLLEIESEVNRQIRANHPVETQLMASEHAIEAGAMALFGEKYPEEVRVVKMGLVGEESYSFELCGGTHVNRSGDIGYFKIISEGGVAAGVRRIEALAGVAAETYIREREEILSKATEVLKVTPQGLVERLQNLQQERRKLEQSLSQARLTGSAGTVSQIRNLGSVNLLWRELQGVPAKDLKPLVDQLKQEIGSGIVVAASVIEGSVSLVVGVTADLINSYNAVDLVRLLSSVVEGAGGGGRPDMAQAGGKNPLQLPAALQALEQHLQQKAA